MKNMQHHKKIKLLNYRHRSGGRILGYQHKPHLQRDDKNKTNKHIPLQIQEEYKAPNKTDQKRNFPQQITVKRLRIQNKEKLLKKSRKKLQIPDKEKPIKNNS